MGGDPGTLHCCKVCREKAIAVNPVPGTDPHTDNNDSGTCVP